MLADVGLGPADLLENLADRGWRAEEARENVQPRRISERPEPRGHALAGTIRRGKRGRHANRVTRIRRHLPFGFEFHPLTI